MAKRRQSASLFSRQVIALGEAAHHRLGKTTFAVIGAGGIGSYSALLLAQAGAKEVRVIDRDVVEESNLPRQCLFGAGSVGKPKAAEAQRVLSSLASPTRVRAFFEQFSPTSAKRLLSGVDVVLDCSDNYETRSAVNSFCWRNRIPWVYAGTIGFRAMVSAVVPRRRPCFACWTRPRTRESCAGAGVMNTAVAFCSALQVQAAIDLACSGKSALEGGVFFADLRKVVFAFKPLSENKGCEVCSVT